MNFLFYHNIFSYNLSNVFYVYLSGMFHVWNLIELFVNSCHSIFRQHYGDVHSVVYSVSFQIAIHRD